MGKYGLLLLFLFTFGPGGEITVEMRSLVAAACTGSFVPH
jgi:hypothetical protein